MAQECVSLYPNSRVTIYDLPKVVQVAKKQFIPREECRISFHSGKYRQQCSAVTAVISEPFVSAQRYHTGHSGLQLLLAWAVSPAQAYSSLPPQDSSSCASSAATYQRHKVIQQCRALYSSPGGDKICYLQNKDTFKKNALQF